MHRDLDRSQRSSILATHLLDREWIGLQLGKELADDRSAAEALLTADEASGPLSPHPLVELAWARPGEPWLKDGAPSLVWFLRARNRREGQTTHPLIDLAAIVRVAPEAVRHPGGPLGHWLERAEPDAALPVPPGMPPMTLRQLHLAARSALAEHTASERVARGPRPIEPTPVPPATPPADTPLVSVLMVTRDDATTLRATVRALEAQRCTAWEVVVVDDASTDDTRAVLAGLAHFDPRVVPVHLARVGRAAALNAGLARARGRHLAFLEPGRSWDPTFLATMTDQLDAHDWPTALGVPNAGAGASCGGDRQELLAGAPVDLSLLVARRDAVTALGGFDEALHDASAHDLAVRLAGDGVLPGLRFDAVQTPHTGRPDEVGDWADALLGKHLVEWPDGPEELGRTGLVLAVGNDVAPTVRWLEEVLVAGDDAPDLVLVGGRTTRTHHVVAQTLATLSARIDCTFVAPRIGVGTAFNLGLSRTPAERVVLARADSSADLDDLGALADEAARPGVALAQPLVVGRDEVIVSAGASFAAATLRPELLLQDHPVRDAQAGSALPIAAPLSPVVAMRRATALSLRGMDASYSRGLPEVELGLRAHAAGLGGSVVVPTVLVTSGLGRVVGPDRLMTTISLLERTDLTAPVREDVWDPLPFDVVGLRNEALRDVSVAADPAVADPVLRPRLVVRPSPPLASRIEELPPRLRWTIDTAVPAHAGKSSWGDVHFAGSLRDALERLGQHVAVDSRDARHRDTRDHDDVVLVLRGLDRVPPRPGPVRVAWVISHPDLVDAEELATYDLVYAASTTWAAAASERWGVSVAPLLQCTDPTLFHPGRSDGDTGPILFVGNSRGVFRTSLRAALAGGFHVEIHGKGWREFLPPDAVTSPSVDNTELGRAYAGASVVLNDHWADMRDSGFLSNRLFDAGACGARIVTDEVGEVTELFGPLVRTFADEKEMARILEDPEAAFGTRAERLERASVIRSEHSFDRRAQTLVDDAAREVRLRAR